MLFLIACSTERPNKVSASASVVPEKAPSLYRVQFDTTRGKVLIEVHQSWAPKGAEHFFDLVRANFYKDVRFHHVVRNHIVQFGINGDPKVHQSMSLSIGDDPQKERNRKGTVAFAASGSNSRSTQIIINLSDNASLDGRGFVPFGEVIEGMDAVEKIYSSYGGFNGPSALRIEKDGNAYLDRYFPRLDSIKSTTLFYNAWFTETKLPQKAVR